MKHILKVAATATTLVLLGSGVAFAQTPAYDRGAPHSGSAGTIVPTSNTSVGVTGTGGASSTTRGTTSGSSTLPGIPNTGAGGNAATTYAVLALAALVAAGGASYLARQRFAR